MKQQIILLFFCFILSGCYTIINPPIISESLTSDEIEANSDLDASYEYDTIDDSSIIIEGDYVNVYNSSHSCDHYHCNRHGHNSYSYSWWWSDYSYCSYSMNYYDWYYWDHHHYNHYHYGHHHNYYDYNWNSNNYSYNPSKKKRRDHSFGRDALGSSNNENNNFEEQSEVLAINEPNSKGKELFGYGKVVGEAIKKKSTESSRELSNKKYSNSKKNKKKESFGFGKVIGEILKKHSAKSKNEIGVDKNKKSKKKTRNVHKRKRL